MSRVFTVERRLHGFRDTKSNIIPPTVTIKIGPSRHWSCLIDERLELPLLARNLCPHMWGQRVIHDFYWMVDCGTSEETAVMCNVAVTRKVADAYTLLGALAAILTLCGLEEVGGGNVNTQNSVYSTVYTALIQDYRSNATAREVISDTLRRLSMEAE